MTVARKTQEKAISSAMNGKDCLVVMATGSGKSLCYQANSHWQILPALTFCSPFYFSDNNEINYATETFQFFKQF